MKAIITIIQQYSINHSEMSDSAQRFAFIVNSDGEIS